MFESREKIRELLLEYVDVLVNCLEDDFAEAINKIHRRSIRHHCHVVFCVKFKPCGLILVNEVNERIKEKYPELAEKFVILGKHTEGGLRIHTLKNGIISKKLIAIGMFRREDEILDLDRPNKLVLEIDSNDYLNEPIIRVVSELSSEVVKFERENKVED